MLATVQFRNFHLQPKNTGGTAGGLLWTWYWTFRFHKMLGNCSVAKHLVAYQGFSSLEFSRREFSWRDSEKSQETSVRISNCLAGFKSQTCIWSLNRNHCTAVSGVTAVNKSDALTVHWKDYLTIVLVPVASSCSITSSVPTGISESTFLFFLEY
jgi:hypothetical protein